MEELFAEIEQLHRESMDMLNRMGWAIEDILLQIELLDEQAATQSSQGATGGDIE